jgi:hypothetical protein
MDDLPPLILLSAVLVLGALAFIAALVTMRRPGLDTLVWWPIVLYIPGPLAIYVLFSGHPSFANYFSPESIVVSTLALVGGFLLYVLFLEKRLARQLREDLAEVARSPAVNGTKWPLVLLGVLCAATQVMLIRDTGASLLSGGYVLADGSFADNSTLFTLTAGLYEIFAALLALRLVAVKPSARKDGLFLLLSFAVLALRMLGGTRLIVLKVVLFVVILQLLRGNISKKAATVSALVFGILLMVVGSLRGSEAEEGANLLFLLFAEPALGNLSATFVTGYFMDHGVLFNPSALLDSIGYLIFIAVHLLPNVIYQALGGGIVLLGDWGYYRSWGEALYPFRGVLAETGLATVSPVGGQSIIALGVALFGYAGAGLIVPFIYGGFSWLRSILPKAMPLVLILGFEAPSVFRDSTEILVKQVFIIAIVFWLFSKLCAIPITNARRAMPRATAESLSPQSQ